MNYSSLLRLSISGLLHSHRASQPPLAVPNLARAADTDVAWTKITFLARSLSLHKVWAALCLQSSVEQLERDSAGKTRVLLEELCPVHRVVILLANFLLFHESFDDHVFRLTIGFGVAPGGEHGSYMIFHLDIPIPTSYACSHKLPYRNREFWEVVFVGQVCHIGVKGEIACRRTRAFRGVSVGVKPVEHHFNTFGVVVIHRNAFALSLLPAVNIKSQERQSTLT